MSQKTRQFELDKTILFKVISNKPCSASGWQVVNTVISKSQWKFKEKLSDDENKNDHSGILWKWKWKKKQTYL